jgi:hypothetical protein
MQFEAQHNITLQYDIDKITFSDTPSKLSRITA